MAAVITAIELSEDAQVLLRHLVVLAAMAGFSGKRAALVLKMWAARRHLQRPCARSSANGAPSEALRRIFTTIRVGVKVEVSHSQNSCCPFSNQA